MKITKNDLKKLIKEELEEMSSVVTTEQGEKQPVSLANALLDLADKWVKTVSPDVGMEDGVAVEKYLTNNREKFLQLAKKYPYLQNLYEKNKGNMLKTILSARRDDFADR
jgi:hypothetical protein